MESIEYKGYTLNVEPDEYADSPKEWGDENLFLVGFHREFSVDHKDVGEGLVRSIFAGNKYEDGSKSEDAVEFSKKYHVFPLEAYIHSGVSLHLGGEARIDRAWDVSMVGALFVAKSEARTKKRAEELARGLIKTWNMYLSGDVWSVSVEDQDGEVLDTCGGFYGYADAEASGKETIDRIAERDAKNPPMYKKEARAWLSVRVPELLSAWPADTRDHAKMAQAIAIAINNL